MDFADFAPWALADGSGYGSMDPDGSRWRKWVISFPWRIHGAGIYPNIWGILMVNVTIYGIHVSYGFWGKQCFWGWCLSSEWLNANLSKERMEQMRSIDSAVRAGWCFTWTCWTPKWRGTQNITQWQILWAHWLPNFPSTTMLIHCEPNHCLGFRSLGHFVWLCIFSATRGNTDFLVPVTNLDVFKYIRFQGLELFLARHCCIVLSYGKLLVCMIWY